MGGDWKKRHLHMKESKGDPPTMIKTGKEI